MCKKKPSTGNMNGSLSPSLIQKRTPLASLPSLSGAILREAEQVCVAGFTGQSGSVWVSTKRNQAVIAIPAIFPSAHPWDD
jgi:hypothetical protein